MRVTVQCFARLRELSGRDEWVCDVPAGSTVGDVWDRLVASSPAAGALAATISCAVNAEFASMRAPVRDGDEVAFLPPVSGGACEQS